MPSVKQREAREGTVDVQLPTVCRILQYTNGEGHVMPAIVTAIEQAADTAPPTPTPVDEGDEPKKDREARRGEAREGRFAMHIQGWDSVMGCGHYFIEDVRAAARGESGEANTWNWPPKADGGEARPEPIGVR